MSGPAAAAGIALAAAGLAGGVVVAGGRTVVDGQVVAAAPAPPLADGLTLAQTFPIVVEGLAAVDVQLANYARPADGMLDVRLADPAGRVLSGGRLAGSAVVDNAWHRFRLAARADLPAGTLLTLSLARREAGGNPVTAWTTAGDIYPPGGLAVDGRPTGGDLAFRAVYHPGWRAGARHVLATVPYPPAATAGLLWGMLAAGLAILHGLARHAAAGGAP